MTAPARSLMFLCCHRDLKVPLQERLARDLSDVQLLDFDVWLLHLADNPSPAVALIVDHPEWPVEAALRNIKNVCPESKLFVYGDNPHHLIARTSEVEEVFSAGVDEGRLVDALREAFAG